MKTVRNKSYNEDVDPPRWEYTITDGITSTGVWSTVKLLKPAETKIYRKLEMLLKEESNKSVKH